MDRINEGTFDQLIDDAIRCEPLAELPVDFSQLFLEQVHVEVKPKFEVISWIDLISSMMIAITIGIAFLIPAFLPEQLSPLMQWVLQWGQYLLTKVIYGLPGFVLTLGVFILTIGIIFIFGKIITIFIDRRKQQKLIINSFLF